MKHKDRTIVGAAERVLLPDWGVRLRAKIDTGAKTSSLHVSDVEELEGDRVKFAIVTSRRTPARRVQVIAPIVRRTTVRSSSGQAEPRIVVATKLSLGGVEKTIEISLTSRKEMIFRMLLGREALAHEFLVDASRRYVHGKPRKRKRRVKKTAARTRRLTRTHLRTKEKPRRSAAKKAKPTSRRKKRAPETGG